MTGGAGDAPGRPAPHADRRSGTGQSSSCARPASGSCGEESGARPDRRDVPEPVRTTFASPATEDELAALAAELAGVRPCPDAGGQAVRGQAALPFPGRVRPVARAIAAGGDPLEPREIERILVPPPERLS